MTRVICWCQSFMVRKLNPRQRPCSERTFSLSMATTAQCILRPCTHSQLFRSGSVLNFWTTLVHIIVSAAPVGIVTIALHDGMIGGVMPAAMRSRRAGQSKTISASVFKAAPAVARASTAPYRVQNVSQSRACKWSTKYVVTTSCAREQQGHSCDPRARCGALDRRVHT